MKDMELTLTKASWAKITSKNHWNACSDDADPVKAAQGNRSIDALQVITMGGQSDTEAVFRALWLLERTDKRTAVYLGMRCAEHVLPIFETDFPDDKRPRRCIQTIKRWLKGRAGDAELEAAAIDCETARASA